MSILNPGWWWHTWGITGFLHKYLYVLLYLPCFICCNIYEVVSLVKITLENVCFTLDLKSTQNLVAGFSLFKLISLYSMLLSSKSLYHVDETSHAKHYQLRLRCFIRVVSRFDIIVVSRAGNISQICDVMAKEIDPFLSLLITLKYQNVCADLQNCNISITFHSIWVVLT